MALCLPSERLVAASDSPLIIELQPDPGDQEIGTFGQARETIEQEHEITHHESHRDDAQNAPGQNDEVLPRVSEASGKVIGHADGGDDRVDREGDVREGDEATVPQKPRNQARIFDSCGSSVAGVEWPRDQKWEIAR